MKLFLSILGLALVVFLLVWGWNIFLKIVTRLNPYAVVYNANAQPIGLNLTPPSDTFTVTAGSSVNPITGL